VELLFVIVVLAIAAGLTIPQIATGTERARTRAAARYLSAQIGMARTQAVTRGAAVAIRFLSDAGGTAMELVMDGNANGLRTLEIEAGIDPRMDRLAALEDTFPGVRFALASDPSGSGIHLSGSSLLTFTPVGEPVPARARRLAVRHPDPRRHRPGAHAATRSVYESVGRSAVTSPAASAVDRRETIRRAPGSTEPMTRMRMRTGQELAVVNLSNAGALVEGTARLLPGTRIDVHVMTRSGRVLTRARVLRAQVSALAASRVVYRAALSFDTAVDTT
jgi:type II secretory pathway pseudopilin PulG